ncbi:hypothetical protein ASPBRDRAFT_334162 [Aspergillus brasiliensis CBS 101740]|uniref:Uncharacterized protein n=1 Tax=Aspergillus brasiliensis (strain CBS 101740 / IMI 381727 / IBT 21946) TaxID=767769 RepID=A0A1L9U7M0_ASPBC|nr:hypothetical protein ASPBRDRAFT_334162 [Aspergillus brasiliensis CBS 101740]
MRGRSIKGGHCHLWGPVFSLCHEEMRHYAAGGVLTLPLSGFGCSRLIWHSSSQPTLTHCVHLQRHMFLCTDHCAIAKALQFPELGCPGFDVGAQKQRTRRCQGISRAKSQKCATYAMVDGQKQKKEEGEVWLGPGQPASRVKPAWTVIAAAYR